MILYSSQECLDFKSSSSTERKLTLMVDILSAISLHCTVKSCVRFVSDKIVETIRAPKRRVRIHWSNAHLHL